MGKLEDTFNITPMEDDEDFDFASEEGLEHLDSLIEETGANSLSTIDMADVINLKEYDASMNEISEKTIAEYEDVIAIGKDCEVRHAGEIISAASTLIKIAMDARNNKAKVRMQLLDLALKKQRLDLMADKQRGAEKPETPGEGRILDRNELLKMVEENLKKGK